MAPVDACNDDMRVISRRLVKASDPTFDPHVVAVSNLDLVPQPIQTSLFCIYPKPRTGEFGAVVAAFESGLPSLLNHFFLLAGRIATNPTSGVPEVHGNNQGAELVVAEAGVPLASLDYQNHTGTSSVRRVLQPYGQDVALSVQLVSFACGGFTVAWRTNHLLVDGNALGFLVSAWSELARTGTLAAGSRSNRDRSVFRPRASPSYSASIAEASTPLESQHQINVLTADRSFVHRLYYIDASDIARLREAASRDPGQRATRVQAVSAYLWKALAGVVARTSEPRCRMGFWVNGRPRITATRLGSGTPNYFGNLITFAVREASAHEILRMPLPDVAAMARKAIMSPATYDEHLQELVDWMEDHKNKKYVETATVGLGSPTVSITAFSSFALDTDFGFGHAAMALPLSQQTARLCSGFVAITAKPGGDGSWIVRAVVWPRRADALESEEPRVFKPVTAEYLGLQFAPPMQHSRI